MPLLPRTETAAEQPADRTLSELVGGRLLLWFGPTVLLLALIVVGGVLGMVTGRPLVSGLGLIPRSAAGLDGVLFSPLLHASWGHLIGNASALTVLSPVAAVVSRRPVLLLVAAWLGSGALTWVIGTPGVHIGASGIVYALTAFLLVYGIAARRWFAVVVSLVVALPLLGSSLIGLIPQAGLSWTGHLAGAVVGVLLALTWGRADRAARRR